MSRNLGDLEKQRFRIEESSVTNPSVAVYVWPVGDSQVVNQGSANTSTDPWFVNVTNSIVVSQGTSPWDVAVTGNIGITGTVNVSGFVSVSGEVSVTQASSPWVVVQSTAISGVVSVSGPVVVTQGTSPWDVNIVSGMSLGVVAQGSAGTATDPWYVTFSASGAMAVTQASTPWVVVQTGPISGIVSVSGTVSVSMTGSVSVTQASSPWIVLQSQAVSGVVSVSGLVSVTQASTPWLVNQVDPMSGVVSVSGLVSVTQASVPWVVVQSSAISGVVSISGPVSAVASISGPVSVTQASSPWIVLQSSPISGTVSVSGNISVSGVVSVSQASSPWVVVQTEPVSGVVAVSGLVQVSQASSPWIVLQSQAISGVVSVSGPVSVTGTVNQGSAGTSTDPWYVTFSAGGAMPVTQASTPWVVIQTGPVSGTVNISGAVSGVVSVSGAVSVTQASSPWIVLQTQPISGVVSVSGNVSVSGLVSVSQASTPWVVVQSSAMSGTVSVSGAVSVTQASSPWIVLQSSAMSGVVSVSGSVLANQGSAGVDPWLVTFAVGSGQPVTQASTPWIVLQTNPVSGVFSLSGPVAQGSAGTSTDPWYVTFAAGGAMPVTQASTPWIVLQSQAMSGVVSVSGTVSVTQASSPWAVRNSFPVSGTVNISGAVSGVVSVSGAVSVTQASSPWIVRDTYAQSGVVSVSGAVSTVASISGTVSVTQASSPWIVRDTYSQSGVMSISGAVSVTQASSPWIVLQSQAVSGVVSVSGAVSGVQSISGTVSVTQASSPWIVLQSQAVSGVVSVSGNVSVSGAVSVTQASSPWIVLQTNPVSGVVSVSGAVSVTQASSPWAVSFSDPISGVVSVSGAVSGVVSVSGAVSVTQASSPWIVNQTNPMSGVVSVSGAVSGVVSVSGAVTTTSNDTVDSGNSTTTPLGIGGVFTGTAFDMSGYSTWSISIATDKASATNGLTIEWSEDATNWDFSDISTNTTPDNDNEITFGRKSRYVRLKYTNGAQAQTYFRVYATARSMVVRQVRHFVGDNIIDTHTGQLVISTIQGKTTAGGGGYVPVKVTPSGAIITEDASDFAEDTAHTTGDKGTQVLSVRTDNPSTTGPLAGTTGDYTPLMTDSKGGLRVSGGRMLEVTGTGAALNATPIAATDCSDFRYVSVQTTGIYTASVAFECSNDNSNWESCGLCAAAISGKITSTGSQDIFSGLIPARYFRVRVDTYSAGTVSCTAEFFAHEGSTVVSLGGGVDTIGNINSVAQVTGYVNPGASTLNLGKAEDASHTPGSGAVGVMALGVRVDSPATTGNLAGSNLDYSPIATDVRGALYTSGGIGLEVTGTGAAVSDTPIAATDVSNYRSLSLQITGTYVASFQLEASNDNSNWTATQMTSVTSTGVVSNTFNASGIYCAPVVARYMRLRITAYTSGTVSARCEYYWRPHTVSGMRVVADTEDAPAAALTDAMSNPTTTRVGAMTCGFNGTTWDRIRTFSSSSTSLGWGSLRVATLSWTQIDADDGKQYSVSTTIATITAGGSTNHIALKGSTTKKLIVDQIKMFSGAATTTVNTFWSIYTSMTTIGTGTTMNIVNTRNGGTATTIQAEKAVTTGTLGSLMYNAVSNNNMATLDTPSLSPLFILPTQSVQSFQLLVRAQNLGLLETYVACNILFREN